VRRIELWRMRESPARSKSAESPRKSQVTTDRSQARHFLAAVASTLHRSNAMIGVVYSLTTVFMLCAKSGV
jgi:hypothetical protein